MVKLNDQQVQKLLEENEEMRGRLNELTHFKAMGLFTIKDVHDMRGVSMLDSCDTCKGLGCDEKNIQCTTCRGSGNSTTPWPAPSPPMATNLLN